MEGHVRLSLGDLAGIESVHDGASRIARRSCDEGSQDLFVDRIVRAAGHGIERAGVADEQVGFVDVPGLDQNFGVTKQRIGSSILVSVALMRFPRSLEVRMGASEVSEPPVGLSDSAQRSGDLETAS
jgi:hypothetical protein